MFIQLFSYRGQAILSHDFKYLLAVFPADFNAVVFISKH
ncbi:hypothetical protein NB724_002684 [Pantoea ananatis]|nr:hypothetical protein [Pantoea ananatis]MCW0335702.1 hypothetical protein [Pantoea ananatis]MCW0383667.1 hypothetical protein [Pantoea ananatis]MCW0408310.1 hypothetical protein [Pantoea ananatis]MCW0428535.1 hypothetical protein [Pantoea ananatis]